MKGMRCSVSIPKGGIKKKTNQTLCVSNLRRQLPASATQKGPVSRSPMWLPPGPIQWCPPLTQFNWLLPSSWLFFLCNTSRILLYIASEGWLPLGSLLWVPSGPWPHLPAISPNSNVFLHPMAVMIVHHLLLDWEILLTGLFLYQLILPLSWLHLTESEHRWILRFPCFVVAARSLTCVQFFVTLWTAARQASLSFTIYLQEFAQTYIL